MPLAKISSAAVCGLNAFPIEVEVDISNGLPSFTIVGLPDKAIEESKERVRSAIRNSGADFPMKRITVNLAPADIKKEGPAYDLPIALGILLADNQIRKVSSDVLIMGELALDGKLRHINGVLPVVSDLKNFNKIILPYSNAAEASLIKKLGITAVNSLKELIQFLRGEKNIDPFVKENNLESEFDSEFDMENIKGQEQAKRALEIAAAGGHNVLFSGPPGSGKTLLARTIPTILPRLTDEEMIEVTKIYSVAGLLPQDKPLMAIRPFRSPHHTTSSVAIVGGGTVPKPGEITLSHRGVLFLDEFPEFPRSVLEALRQPLEDGVVTVSRAQGSVSFPAKFILVAAQNPCPCGYLGDQHKNCICTPTQILRYQKRVSGPLLDRIDIHVEVPRLKYEKLAEEKPLETSKQIRQRVEAARQIQWQRSGKINAELGVKELKNVCKLSVAATNVLKAAVNQLHLSARQFSRILKVARTIADLGGLENIEPSHLAEALHYRAQEKNY